MKYLIKSLKWTKHYKKETWWGHDSSGYTDFICNAGIYTEEDKIKKEPIISSKDIAFVPITEALIEKGKKQLKQEYKKEQKHLDDERIRYEKTIMSIYKRFDLLKTKEKELLKLEEFIND